MPSDAGQVPATNKASWAAKARLLSLSDLDARTRAARDALRLRAGILNDLGGDQHTSVAQCELAQRAAVLGAMIEDAEAKWLRGEPVDLVSLCTLVNAQRRVLADLGLERTARDVSSIRDLVRRNRGEVIDG